ncbi:MAG: flagellar biosynthetic protein FliO [Armatimonadetes bacterium]|nr:flagellar biosynthetic protein FliO [Armatimonadota bacterium]
MVLLLLAAVAGVVFAQGPEPKTKAEEIAEMAAARAAAKEQAKAEKPAATVKPEAKSLEDLAASGSKWAQQKLDARRAPRPVEKTTPAPRVTRAPRSRPVETVQPRPVTNPPAAASARERNSKASAARPVLARPSVTEERPTEPAHAAKVKSSARSTAAPAAAVQPDRESQGKLFEPEGQSSSFGTALTGIGAGLGFLAKLALVLVLAYLSVVALKLFWTRTGKPLRFGARTLIVEESAPLSAGTAVHLVNINGKRFLVGTAQGQVNILAALDDNFEIKEPELRSARDHGSGSTTGAESSAQTLEHEDSPSVNFMSSLLPAVLEGFKSRLGTVQARPKQPAQQPAAARKVAAEIRKSTQFIDELRSRLESPQV